MTEIHVAFALDVGIQPWTLFLGLGQADILHGRSRPTDIEEDWATLFRAFVCPVKPVTI